MNRRQFLAGAAASIACPLAAAAQPHQGMPQVGVLVAESAPHPFTEALRTGMRDLGYVEGRTVAIEWRYADALFARAVELATGLVRLKVDIIAAHHTPAVTAAMRVTHSIPIVMAPAGAPVQTGLVPSLAHPGSNVTGLSSMEAELGSKRLELLAAMLPNLRRVAVLGAKTDPFTRPYVADFVQAGVQLGLEVEPFLLDSPTDFEAVFTAMHTKRAQAVIIQPLFQTQTPKILALARQSHLPVLSSYRDTTEAGGLLSYSADHAGYFQRAATFVDRILKGAKPGDLPVEQPTKFELVINVKTAKALGVTIPPSVLLRADEVIR